MWSRPYGLILTRCLCLQWQVYNSGAFESGGYELGDRLCGHLSSEYRARQTDPLRIALMDDSPQRKSKLVVLQYTEQPDVNQAPVCVDKSGMRIHTITSTD